MSQFIIQTIKNGGFPSTTDFYFEKSPHGQNMIEHIDAYYNQCIANRLSPCQV